MGADQQEAVAVESQVDQSDRRMGYPCSDRLVRLGFRPDTPCYEVCDDDVRFDIGLVKRALFDSTGQDPVTLPLRLTDITDSIGEVFPLHVVSVQAVFDPQEFDHLGLPVGCYNEPDWLVRGHLPKNPHDPYPEFIWVIAKLVMDGSDRSRIDRIEVQLMRGDPRPW